MFVGSVMHADGFAMQALMGVRSVVSVFSFAGVVVEVVSGYSVVQSKLIQLKN